MEKLGVPFFIVVGIICTIAEFYGLYIAYNDSFSQGVIATILPPYAIFLGIIGFFN